MIAGWERLSTRWEESIGEGGGGGERALPSVEHVRGDGQTQKGQEEWRRGSERSPRWIGPLVGERERGGVEAGMGEWARGPSTAAAGDPRWDRMRRRTCATIAWDAADRESQARYDHVYEPCGSRPINMRDDLPPNSHLPFFYSSGFSFGLAGRCSVSLGNKPGGK